eukprot:Opistho-1_new@65988
MWTRARPCRAPCSTRCWPPRTSRAGCRPCAKSSSRSSTCACTRSPAAKRPCRPCWTRCARKSRSSRRPTSTASSTASPTSSPVATRPATTATNGPSCSAPMPGAPSRRKACSTRARARDSCTAFWKPAAPATRWTASRLSVAASPASTRCCGTRAWPEAAQAMAAKTVLITGCSSGIGEALALEFHRRGHRVIATARRRSSLDGLAAQGLLCLALDVNEEASIAALLAALPAQQIEHLDLLVNNAGYGQFGAVIDTEAQELRRQFETTHVLCVDT